MGISIKNNYPKPEKPNINLAFFLSFKNEALWIVVTVVIFYNSSKVSQPFQF